MPTRHPRIQVTEDPELSRALRSAARHLPEGLSRAGQVRELALAGARHLAERPQDEHKRQELLQRLADSFADPDNDDLDWDLLREGKRDAWPLP